MRLAALSWECRTSGLVCRYASAAAASWVVSDDFRCQQNYRFAGGQRLLGQLQIDPGFAAAGLAVQQDGGAGAGFNLFNGLFLAGGQRRLQFELDYGSALRPAAGLPLSARTAGRVGANWRRASLKVEA